MKWLIKLESMLLFPFPAVPVYVALLLSSVSLSPVWEVSRGALQALASSRLCSLAQPRAPAAGWQPDRLLPDPVSSENNRGKKINQIIIITMLFYGCCNVLHELASNSK